MVYNIYNKQTEENQGPYICTHIGPKAPQVAQIQARHWRTMVHDNSYLAEVFTRPPLTAYRRRPNIKGMKKCSKEWPVCPYIKEGKGVKINYKEWKIKKPYDCDSYNVVYAVICKKGKFQKAYLGETNKMLNFVQHAIVAISGIKPQIKPQVNISALQATVCQTFQ